MIINDSSLRTLYAAFNTAFREGVEGAPSRYRNIAMVVPSSTEKEN